MALNKTIIATIVASIFGASGIHVYAKTNSSVGKPASKTPAPAKKHDADTKKPQSPEVKPATVAKKPAMPTKAAVPPNQPAKPAIPPATDKSKTTVIPAKSEPSAPVAIAPLKPLNTTNPATPIQPATPASAKPNPHVAAIPAKQNSPVPAPIPALKPTNSANPVALPFMLNQPAQPVLPSINTAHSTPTSTTQKQSPLLPVPIVEKAATAGISAGIKKGITAALSSSPAATAMTPAVSKALVAEMKAPTVPGLVVQTIKNEITGQTPIKALDAATLKAAAGNTGLSMAANMAGNIVMEKAGGENSTKAQIAKFVVQQGGVLAAAATGGLPGAIRQEFVVVGGKLAEIAVVSADVVRLHVQTAQINADTHRLQQQLAAKAAVTSISSPN